MNWKGFANWLLNGVGAFLMGFFGVPMFGDSMTFKTQMAAGVSAGLAAFVSHLRNNPFKMDL